METELSGSSICNNDQEELLKTAKEKMGEVKEENERLKKLLAQIVKEYQSLEKQISTMARSKNESTETNSSSGKNQKEEEVGNQEQELISLTLGSWSSSTKKHSIDDNNKKQLSDDTLNKRQKVEGDLALALCKFEHNPTTSASDSIKNSSLENTNKESKEEENLDTWGSSSRDLNPKENTSSREGDDQESLHQPQVKKTRVCIRSRCDSPTIHDGCHWRKYGQKIAKGNPCPRAYYRCTVSPNCPVRKQVQRCPQDMSILITTYEGTHNHPLPLSATAMASATSAAAAMIKTGSLTSQTPTLSRPLTTSSLGLHASNLMTPFNNPSLISASSHNSHPTVTLDLTVQNSGFSSFDWLSSSSYASTSSRNSSFLNFSSSPASSSLPSLDFSTSSLPTSSSWANGYLLPYNNTNNSSNTTTTTNNNNNNPRSNMYPNPSTSQQQSLNETIAAAATKAIASNPNFQSVLAAAISSYVGNKVNNNNNNDQKKPVFTSSSSQPIEGSQGLALFPTALPLSTPKSNASLAADARDHIG